VLLKSPLFILFFVAATTGAGILSASLYMKIPLDFVLIMTLASITFATYGINRYTDIEDAVNDTAKADFFKKHSYLLTVSIVMLVISVAALLLTGKFTLYHFFLILTGIAYSVRMVPFVHKGRIIFKRLKDIPFAKSVSVSLSWGTSYFVINWIIYPSLVSNGFLIVLLMISFVLACFVNTNFCDTLDITGDSLHNVPTLPVTFGIKNTYLYGMLIPSSAFFMFILYAFGMKLITLPFLCFLLFNLFYPVVYISLNHCKKYPRSIIVPVTDLSCVIFPLGVFALYFAGY
jgi:4-hydroxybenzoate polyprenyltransferase